MVTTTAEKQSESFDPSELCDAHKDIARELERAAISVADLDALAIISDCAEAHRESAREIGRRIGAIRLRPELITDSITPIRKGDIDPAAADPFTLLIRAERIERRTARLLDACADAADQENLRSTLSAHAARFERCAAAISDRRDQLRSRRVHWPRDSGVAPSRG